MRSVGRSGLLLAMVGLVVGSFAGWRWWAEHRLPRYQGHSVRVWFGELCRHDGGRDGSWAYRDEARLLESKTALVMMATNAVPYLLEQALRAPTDGALRTNLHQWFRELPAWSGGGGFVPHSRIAELAAMEVHALRPPPELVVPRLTTALASPDPIQRRQAVILLGSVRHASPAVLDALQPALTNVADPWLSALAAQSLRWLGPSASNALPRVLDKLADGTPNIALYAWLGGLGPLAAPAIPHLEPALASTNDWIRLNAAVALVAIQPGHARARQILVDAAQPEEPNEDRQPRDDRLLRSRLRTPGDTLARALTFGQRNPDATLASHIEPLARSELDTWTPKNPGHEAIRAYERLAPDRAAVLYRAALTGPSAIPAAAGLLRLERTNAAAVAILEAQTAGALTVRVQALWALGEASSTNPGVTNFLERSARGGGIEARWAAQSLARLRLREARLAAGLSENEWE